MLVVTSMFLISLCSIRRGVGYFGFDDASWQQFQLQLCQSISTISCYITIQPLSDLLSLHVLLQQRRNLLIHLKSCIAEASKCCMPSAKLPVTCLECPHHEEDCMPHVVLDIDKEKHLVCYKRPKAVRIPEESYILLYKGM